MPDGKRKRTPREKIPAKVAREQFTNILDRAALRDEQFIVTMNGKDYVAIIGMKDLSTLDGAA